MVEPRTLLTHPEVQSHASLPLFKTLGEKPRSRLEKLLSVMADVRAGEGVSAMLLAVNFFILLYAYYFLKPARDALILSERSPEVASYSAAAQAGLLMFIVPVYGWFASRVDRFRLVAGATLFFCLHLVLFWFFGTQGAREGVLYYIWIGIFNMFVVAQFWAFANDIYTEGQGRRLFPMLCIGSNLGAWLGGVTAKGLVQQLGLTPYQLMLAGAALLLLPVAILWVVHNRERYAAPPDVAAEAIAPLGPEGGFQLIWNDKYLFWIATLILLLNLVNSNGEYILKGLVTDEAQRVIGVGDAFAAERTQFLTAFFAGYYSWVNLLGFLLQALAVSRIVRYLGVRGSMFVLPALAFVSYTFLAGAPILAVVGVVKVLENSTDYSLMNVVRQAFWLPVSREAKYKAKTAVDSFFVRSGDMLQGLVVYAGVSIGMGVRSFAALNVVLTMAWLYAAWRVHREHRRLTV